MTLPDRTRDFAAAFLLLVGAIVTWVGERDLAMAAFWLAGGLFVLVSRILEDHLERRRARQARPALTPDQAAGRPQSTSRLSQPAA